MPDRIPPVETELGGLSHPRRASAVPFLAEGESAWVEGVESRPGFRVGILGAVVATVAPAGLGAAANVLLFPGVVRRDFAGRGGTCVETILAAPALPLMVGQWRGRPGSAPRSIAVELPGARPRSRVGAGSSIGTGGSSVALDTEHGTVAVGVSPPGASIELTWEGATATLLVEPDGTGELAIVVSAGSARAVRAAFAAAAHTPSHAVGAAAGPDGGLLLHTGLGEVDDGVRWLRSRLSGAIARRAPRGALELTLGLAAIAVGDRAGAARLLSGAAPPPPRSSPHHATASGEPSGGSEPGAASPTHALLAARFASTFGDPSYASAVARTWSAGPPAVVGLVGVAAEQLAEALDRSEPPGLIDALRSLARPERARNAIGGRRLPMARPRAGGRDEWASWVEGLLSGEPATPAPRAFRPTVSEARRACALFRTDPDAAWTVWRRLLTHPSGSAESDSAVLWDDVESTDESLTAELLHALAYGMLGLRADAPAGRIRIAPRIPSHLTAFAVSGLPVGSCALRMDYERSEGRHRFTVTPEIAPVPPVAIFEPAVRGRVAMVRIDGQVAELDPRSAGAWTVVPAQLPIDGVRSLEIETR